MHIITVKQDVMQENAEIAAINKKNFDDHGVFVLNIMSAPGAGKTTILEKLISSLKQSFKVGVIEGDMVGSADKERLDSLEIPIHQINTHSLCHLDAGMINGSLENFDLHELDCIIIENVGNLVCPAEFDLGEDKRVMIASVSEGHDKPAKYPIMFRACQTIVLNKTDLLKGSNFDMEKFNSSIESLNPKGMVIQTSAISGEGVSNLTDLVSGWIKNKKEI